MPKRAEVRMKRITATFTDDQIQRIDAHRLFGLFKPSRAAFLRAVMLHYMDEVEERIGPPPAFDG